MDLKSVGHYVNLGCNGWVFFAQKVMTLGLSVSTTQLLPSPEWWKTIRLGRFERHRRVKKKPVRLREVGDKWRH